MKVLSEALIDLAKKVGINKISNLDELRSYLMKEKEVFIQIMERFHDSEVSYLFQVSMYHDSDTSRIYRNNGEYKSYYDALEDSIIWSLLYILGLTDKFNELSIMNNNEKSDGIQIDIERSILFYGKFIKYRDMYPNAGIDYVMNLVNKEMTK